MALLKSPSDAISGIAGPESHEYSALRMFPLDCPHRATEIKEPIMNMKALAVDMRVSFRGQLSP